jgi:hypothetical protein
MHSCTSYQECAVRLLSAVLCISTLCNTTTNQPSDSPLVRLSVSHAATPLCCQASVQEWQWNAHNPTQHHMCMQRIVQQIDQ